MKYQNKPQKFTCPMCKETRERGSYVQLKSGTLKGGIIKVCKSEECKKAVKKLEIENPT